MLNLYASEKQVRLERLRRREFPYPITPESRRHKRNKISGLTSTHPNLFVVPPSYLLVDNLLPTPTEGICSAIYPASMGMY
ncbi:MULTISPECIES: hypothetical protein [unclassified Microcoleus]|uniref:hypothetical protein n=1 Tax=unclassified Microcoleus TaxID=2642155 RepID=UPI002FD58DEB